MPWMYIASFGAVLMLCALARLTHANRRIGERVASLLWACRHDAANLVAGETDDDWVPNDPGFARDGAGRSAQRRFVLRARR